MSQQIQSDTKCFDVEMTEEKSTMEMEVTEGGSVKNKAAGFNPDNDPRSQQQAINQTLNNPGGFQTLGPFTQFNMSGNTVDQLSVGNQGPVAFNKQEKVYAKGALSSRYNIMGGNFTQANIGGATKYDNANARIGAGGGNGKCYAITPELFLEIIIQKGATAEELIKLLGKGYSLGHIACALPEDASLRVNVVNAMLV